MFGFKKSSGRASLNSDAAAGLIGHFEHDYPSRLIAFQPA
ncbi:hypothetical protein TeGR_g12867, partial [Tetraparma gracilis]